MEYDPSDYYQAIDNDFNRANYPNEIGKYYRNPPSYVAVKVLDASERVKARNYFDALKRKAKEERYIKLKEFAYHQGISLVRLTPRRFIVVVNTGLTMPMVGNNQIVYMGGQIMCGPASHEDCFEFIKNYCKPLPKELSDEAFI